MCFYLREIVHFNFITDKAWLFDYLSENFQMICWVPGNHEYYQSDLSLKCGSFLQKIHSNVFLINDYAVSIEKVRLIFSTLWTTVKPEHQIAIDRRMNDFYMISKMGNRLTCQDVVEEHEISLAFIKKEFTEDISSMRKIVVTPHVPTFMNYPSEYVGDVRYETFALELKDLIKTCGPDYWLYGHHHQNMPDFKIGKTTLITNQLGYVRLT